MSALTLSTSVALAPAEDGYLAYDLATGRLHHLNPTAALIVELCDGHRDGSGICAALGPVLGASGLDACRAWIASARAMGLLVDANHTAGGAGPSPAALAAQAQRLRDEGQVVSAFVCQWDATHRAGDDADQWHALGELAHIVGRRDTAREAYERYLVLRPGDEEIAHILVSLRDEPPPPRAPDRCIEQLYARFATFYDESMCGDLDYRAPACLDVALHRTLGERRGLRVLELGCGTGLAGRLLRARASSLTGIDLSAAMVARARATGLYDVLEVAEITAWLARPDGPAFDLVAACDTFIYFGDLRQVVVPAAARVDPGGWLAFTLERSTVAPFRLTDSGRYAHQIDHVRDVAAEAGCAVLHLEEAVLRHEYGEPVDGLVVVMGK